MPSRRNQVAFAFIEVLKKLEFTQRAIPLDELVLESGNKNSVDFAVQVFGNKGAIAFEIPPSVEDPEEWLIKIGTVVAEELKKGYYV